MALVDVLIMVSPRKCLLLSPSCTCSLLPYACGFFLPIIHACSVGCSIGGSAHLARVCFPVSLFSLHWPYDSWATPAFNFFKCIVPCFPSALLLRMLIAHLCDPVAVHTGMHHVLWPILMLGILCTVPCLGEDLVETLVGLFF